ncbi:DoxX family protein [Haloprofundus salinisoli]|uniref:DoxX family protein n=1 Tax=Haloprofundus salinisoli TaxID=2876193 RepID=UPI003CE45AFC
MQSAVAFDGPAAGFAFLVGRVLFGGVLAFNGLNHFLDSDQMVGYAQAKGVPAPGLAVPLTGGMLLFGGIGIALGVLPTLSAGALVVFLLVTTPLMHDFWDAPEGQQQSEMINFLKNVAMLGGALAFLALGAAGAWPYAL